MSQVETPELTFDTHGWQEITIKVWPLGKGPAKYGEGVFRFGSPIALTKAMKRQGWEIVRRNASHVYARPPHGLGKAPYNFIFHIPSKQQALEIAEVLFARQKSWAGIIGDWMVICLSQSKVTVTEVYSCIKGQTETEPKPWNGFTMAPSICFGDSGLWSVHVDKRNNETVYFPDERFPGE